MTYNFPAIDPEAVLLRDWASNLRQMFLALKKEGFTEDQAFTLVRECVAPR